MSYVYVSNAEDGVISTYVMRPDTGELQPGLRTEAGPAVMPMTVSADHRFLFAALRGKPHTVITFAIDFRTGALQRVSTAPLPESMPYIALDKTARFLFGASYAGNLVSVSAVGTDGRVSATPLQVIPIGRSAHSVAVDASNRYVFVPTLGSDAVFQFTFDENTGRLASNTPAVVLVKPLTGPRHVIASRDNKFFYVLNEMLGTVTSFGLDSKTGLLTELDSASGVPAEAKLVPGAVRGAQPPRNTDNDIWAADVHMTPDDRFMYMSERTGSTLALFNVNAATGKLTYVASTPTEQQPRGFAIHPNGKFLVATGEKSETISVYAIDPATGALRMLQKYPTGKGANWVEIVGVD
ncbi:MAG: beta-propeller fold lactonase family protein [Betaproteobacteria bacterium]